MKDPVIHYADYGLDNGFSVCGHAVGTGRVTSDLKKVTCKICLRTIPYKDAVERGGARNLLLAESPSLGYRVQGNISESHFHPDVFDQNLATKLTQHGTIRWKGTERRIRAGDILNLLIGPDKVVQGISINGRRLEEIEDDS